MIVNEFTKSKFKLSKRSKLSLNFLLLKISPRVAEIFVLFLNRVITFFISKFSCDNRSLTDLLDQVYLSHLITHQKFHLYFSH